MVSCTRSSSCDRKRLQIALVFGLRRNSLGLLQENGVLLQLVQCVPSVDVFAFGQRRLDLAHTILKIYTILNVFQRR